MMKNNLMPTSYSTWVMARLREKLSDELAKRMSGVRLIWNADNHCYRVCVVRTDGETHLMDVRFMGREHRRFSAWMTEPEIARLILFLQ